ncbi:MAG: hypothetical protein M3Q71_09700 [Chloroflexota bacterium]|nr:hypothetical protein [Chloroflexota bacterium]MDP9470922.1 hypothetical protein [Chloroflexota bacterium]
MKVTLQAVRVYGSASRYGDTARTSPLDGPLVMNDFPLVGERTWLLLGVAPESIFQAMKVRRALGRLGLDSLLGSVPATMAEKIERLEQYVAEAADAGDFPSASKFEWFITFAVEREVEIEEANLGENPYLWIDPNLAASFKDALLEHASPYLDLLSTYVSTVVGPEFFEKVVLDDRVVYTASERKPFSLPTFSGSANMALIHTDQALDLTKLRALLETVASMPRQQHDWLNKVAQWYLRTLREDDPWKQFLWGFTALEILAHRLWGGFYDKVSADLVLKNSSASAQGTLGPAISRLLWPKEASRIPITAKFALVALSLSPRTASADVETFAKVKQARDDLAHGGLDKEQELPRTECCSLLARYLALAAEAKLALPMPEQDGPPAKGMTS